MPSARCWRATLPDAVTMSGEPKTRERALLLCHRIPWPPDKGDKIRSWRLVEHLSQNYSLSLGFFVDDPDDEKHVPYLEGFCDSLFWRRLDPLRARTKSLSGLITGEPLTFPYYRDTAMRNWVKGEREKGLAFELAFSSSMVPYIEESPFAKFADLVDADSAKWSGYAARKSFPMSFVYRREGRLLAREEARISRTMNRTFLISPEEADIVRVLPGADNNKIDWWANGVDTEYFDPAADFAHLPERTDLIFTGAMDYWANAEAICEFVETVWPSLKKAHPSLTLTIAGARPLPEVQRLAQLPGIAVTGRVDDMRSWLSAAKIAIAPLNIARGVQNKVLEAMAMGLPVVASPEAALGISCEQDRELFISRDAGEMTRMIGNLLNDEALRTRTGAAARTRMVSDFGWAPCLLRLTRHLPQAR